MAAAVRRVAAPYEVRVNEFCADFTANPSVSASPSQLPCRGAHGGADFVLPVRGRFVGGGDLDDPLTRKRHGVLR